MYNIPSALRVRGELRRELLEQALGEVVRRHEVLRTRFEVSDGQPMQRIRRGEAGLDARDYLSGLEEREREKQRGRLQLKRRPRASISAADRC